METGWVTLKVVDHEPVEGGDLTCVVCGGWKIEREIALTELSSGKSTRMGLHRRCEVKLKKLESEELHQLYEQLTAMQERCTRQEEELRDLRKKIAAFGEPVIQFHPVPA
jgi:hypothetical protein